MNKKDFYRAATALSILGLDRTISDKKKLVKYGISKDLSIDELKDFIEKAKIQQKCLIKQYQSFFNENIPEIKRYAKSIEEDFGDLYLTAKCFYHNYIFDFVKNEDPKEDHAVQYYKDHAAEIKKQYVTE